MKSATVVPGITVGTVDGTAQDCSGCASGLLAMALRYTLYFFDPM